MKRLPPATSLVDEVTRLSALAWPVVVGNLGAMGMGVADTIMVGRFGGDALAAVALATAWSWGVAVVARNAAKGLDPIVAQAFGAGDRQAAGRALVHGLTMAAGLSLPVALLHLLARPGLTLLGQPQQLLGLAGPYATIMALGVPGVLIFMVLRQFLQGLGVVKPVTVAVLVANVLNIVLNLLFMNGAFGWSGLGPIGCAWSSVLGQACLVLVLLWLSRGTLIAWWPAEWRSLLLDSRGVRQILKLGLPVGLQIAIETWGFQFAGLMVGWLGQDALAAHTIALNLATVSFMTPLGVGAAAATRVGNLAGARQPWGRTAALAIAGGASVMVVSAAVFTLWPASLARIYTTDLSVIAVAVTLIPVAGAFQLFDGVQAVSFGVLRGLADVRVPMLINVVAYWGLGMPTSYVLAFKLGLGAPGIWLGLIVSLALVSSLLLVRIRRLSLRGVAPLS